MDFAFAGVCARAQPHFAKFRTLHLCISIHICKFVSGIFHNLLHNRKMATLKNNFEGVVQIIRIIIELLPEIIAAIKQLKELDKEDK